MNIKEAQHILKLCRPASLEDHNDPLIAEAFERLIQDDELQVWFDDQQSFGASVSAELSRVELPEDLKISILAGMRAHQKLRFCT